MRIVGKINHLAAITGGSKAPFTRPPWPIACVVEEGVFGNYYGFAHIVVFAETPLAGPWLPIT